MGNPRTLPYTVIGCILLTVACGGDPPPNPAADQVSWRSYTDDVAGYTLELPDAYEVQPHEGGLILRLDGYLVVSVSHVDEAFSSLQGA